MKIAALLVAAGRGRRAGGDTPKQWRSVSGKRVIEHTVERFQSHPLISSVLVVIHRDDHGRYDLGLPFAFGGETRQASVQNGLLALAEQRPDLVLIHDVARAAVPEEVITRVIAALHSNEAAAPALALTDALWVGHEGQVTGAHPRDGLFRAQTPQGFHYDKICKAHQNGDKNAPDDVSLAIAAGLNVAIVQGSEDNFKITHPDDFKRMEKRIRNEF